MDLWTTWADHYASGEGRTLMAQISYCQDETDARQKFKQTFGDFFAVGCGAAPGVVTNAVTNYLFSERHLHLIKSEVGNAKSLDTHVQFHISFVQ